MFVVVEIDAKVKSGALALAEPIMRWASRAYVAGPDFESTQPFWPALESAGVRGIVGFWNAEELPPEDVAREHLSALSRLGRNDHDVYLAIKAPALGFSHRLVIAIATRANDVSVRLHFDAQRPETVDQTWSLVETACTKTRSVGCTLPGRFARSVNDAEWAIRERLAVRVVKGQVADPKAPDIDPRQGFLEVIDALAGRARLVGVASHDVTLVRESLIRLLRKNTPCELELLLGLPITPLLGLARMLGVPVRLYVPYGSRRLPYHVSDAARNIEVIRWLFRDITRKPTDCLDEFRRSPIRATRVTNAA